jgi:manganese/zinc/iron transport system permease protein
MPRCPAWRWPFWSWRPWAAPGKHLGGLLLGATVTGLLGMGAVQLIRTTTRLKEDAALGIVLSVFFGLGRVAAWPRPENGDRLGRRPGILHLRQDRLHAGQRWLAYRAGGGLHQHACAAALFKVLAVLCFDPDYARAQGWPVAGLDALLMGMVVAVTVVGLQAVGLILVVALLVIPAAAARFWSDDLRVMVALSTAIGGLSCLLGALWSALTPRLPAGAMMVLVASAIFVVSLLAGRARGVVARALAYRRMVRHLRSQRGGAGMVTP